VECAISKIRACLGGKMHFLLEEINVLPHFSSITLEDMGEKEDILGGRV
jgi:hypothetical protein